MHNILHNPCMNMFTAMREEDRSEELQEVELLCGNGVGKLILVAYSVMRDWVSSLEKEAAVKIVLENRIMRIYQLPYISTLTIAMIRTMTFIKPFFTKL
nr:unnamed protein product [Callosobruchus chinensis]